MGALQRQMRYTGVTSSWDGSSSDIRAEQRRPKANKTSKNRVSGYVI